MTRLITYLPTPGGLTGAPRRLLTLAGALRSQGFEVCIAADADSELLMEANRRGFETRAVSPVGVLALRGGALFGGGVMFRLRTGWSLLRQNIRFWSAVKSFNADVVWIRASKGIAFAGLGKLLASRPLIWDVDYELPSKGLVRWLHRFGLWTAAAVVFQYRSAPVGVFGGELSQRYVEKFHSIIPGIDLDSVRPYRERRRSREIEPGRPFTILQVGTICDRKNQLLVLEALDKLKARDIPERPEVRVRFVGGFSDQEYEKRVRASIADMGLGDSVELLGWRDDVHALMAEADLLVMPSRDEGVPNTVQEAMYIGLPAIVGDAGGMPEVVDHGVTGWVLPVDDPGMWAGQIECCLRREDRCVGVGNAAAIYAEQHFGTENWGAQYAHIISSVAPRSTLVFKD